VDIQQNLVLNVFNLHVVSWRFDIVFNQIDVMLFKTLWQGVPLLLRFVRIVDVLNRNNLVVLDKSVCIFFFDIVFVVVKSCFICDLVRNKLGMMS
jgi:hypothetical protein